MTITKLLTTLTAGLLCIGAVHAKTLTSSTDLSQSNHFLQNQHFADSAAVFVANEIEKLKDGDTVRLMSFGSRKEAANIKKQSYIISRRQRAKKTAKAIGAHIRSIPATMKKGQSSTNLIAWLEFTSGFDCKNGSTIIVITDGLEASSIISAQDFKSGKKSLPKPKVDLTGCTVIFYGLGAGMEYQEIQTIKSGWTRYMQEAGATFIAEIP